MRGDSIQFKTLEIRARDVSVGHRQKSGGRFFPFLSFQIFSQKKGGRCASVPKKKYMNLFPPPLLLLQQPPSEAAAVAAAASRSRGSRRRWRSREEAKKRGVAGEGRTRSIPDREAELNTKGWRFSNQSGPTSDEILPNLPFFFSNIGFKHVHLYYYLVHISLTTQLPKDLDKLKGIPKKVGKRKCVNIEGGNFSYQATFSSLHQCPRFQRIY